MATMFNRLNAYSKPFRDAAERCVFVEGEGEWSVTLCSVWHKDGTPHRPMCANLGNFATYGEAQAHAVQVRNVLEFALRCAPKRPKT